MQRNAIILAAGKGTRMQSELPKVLHEVHGRPMLQFVVDAVQNVGARPYVVVGFGANQVREAFDNEALSFVEQREQLGTGHAVQQVVPLLEANADSQTVVLAGDCPLIRPETLQLLFDSHQQSQAAATVLSAHMENPFGYGRILRDENDNVLAIREQKDCSDSEAAVTEINSGIYVFNTALLCEYIGQLSAENKQREYYLTDMLEILRQAQFKVAACCIENANEVIGINSKDDLARVEEIVLNR